MGFLLRLLSSYQGTDGHVTDTRGGPCMTLDADGYWLPFLPICFSSQGRQSKLSRSQRHKRKHFCSVECQKIAVNGLEPRDARRLQSRIFPAFLMQESVSATLIVESSFWMLRKEVSINPCPAHQPSSGFWSFKHLSSCMDTPLPFKAKGPVPSLSSHRKRELLIFFDIYEPPEPGDRCFSVLWPCPGEPAANPFLTCCCVAQAL
ncbi:hypothetical protein LEMLEM_LOCUS6654 [Lemmus lemmus]